MYNYIHGRQKKIVINQVRKCFLLTVLIVLSVAGFFFAVSLTSQRGIGLVGHGAEYIRMARNLLDHNSLKEEILNYWQHFPPLYPLTLVAIHWAGGPEPLLAARWANALIYGMNIFLVGYLIYKQTEKIWFVILGAVWMLVKIDIVEIHTVAMSEPLFIFWVLVWLVFFLEYLKTWRLGSLVGFSIAAGLACSTRFAGITLIITGIMMLFIAGKREAISKIFGAVVVFLALSSIPMNIWAVNNFFDDGRAVNRSFFFHPASIPFDRYLWPLNSNHEPLMQPLLVVLVLLGWILWVRRDRAALENIPRCKESFFFMTIIFMAVYVAAWIITISFFDAEAYCVRYFIPVEIFNLFFWFSWLAVLLSVTKSPVFLKVLFCGILGIFLIGINVKSAAQWYVKRTTDGVDYDGKAWDDSEMIQKVMKLPPSTVIYTNNVEALYVRANRQATPLTLVSKVDMITLRENPYYDYVIEKMKADLKSKRGLIVYFPFNPQNNKLPMIDELKKEVPLKRIFKASDGEIYAWKERGS